METTAGRARFSSAGGFGRRTMIYMLPAGILAGGGAMALVNGQRPLSVADARDFVKQGGDKLVAIVTGPYSEREKRDRIDVLISGTVDIRGIARFALGQFWNVATPAQQAEFLRVLHVALVGDFMQALGAYPGISFTVDRGTPRDDYIAVSTTIFIPEVAPRGIDWVVGLTDQGMRIVDVIAEGTSLRITERDDVARLMAEHGNDIAAMIDAMRRETAEE